ncbi:hypothetical protein BD289DRAFT_46056 [Coniella lustricola]|uniref:Uncharacterized protein n=1 Tax=Coniella lustricola TaxID=2025994 RepID=A0A2T3A1J2_9PEZI|nr:hypothetical protein BD289DRAFT_46056 [Coniella lustricola]
MCFLLVITINNRTSACYNTRSSQRVRVRKAGPSVRTANHKRKTLDRQWTSREEWPHLMTTWNGSHARVLAVSLARPLLLTLAHSTSSCPLSQPASQPTSQPASQPIINQPSQKQGTAEIHSSSKILLQLGFSAWDSC